MLVAVGPQAELAVNRVMLRAVREQLADAQAISARREREAFEAGVHHGRAAWPIGLLMGVMIGAAATGLYFVLIA